MQVNKTNNVIILKDVESNIIEEAVVVLKKGVEIKNIKKKKMNKIENINVLKEAELIVNQKIRENDTSIKEYIINKLEKKNKILKLLNMLFIFFIILTLVMK